MASVLSTGAVPGASWCTGCLSEEYSNDRAMGGPSSVLWESIDNMPSEQADKVSPSNARQGKANTHGTLSGLVEINIQMRGSKTLHH